jgi:hypothetical protein
MYSYNCTSSTCQIGGNVATPNAVIPDLIPSYISKLPTDPYVDTTSNNYCCYQYLVTTGGIDYKLFFTGCANSASYTATGALADPARTHSWAVYSPGAKSL